MISNTRFNRILVCANQSPEFRQKIIKLGQLADGMTLYSYDKFAVFMPIMIKVAHEAGLIGDDLDQNTLDELKDWFIESANEIAYFLQKPEPLKNSENYKTPAGYVFLSWTVKNPRDREAICGMKDALDWFNIKYFDYTEHQLDDDEDKNDEIRMQLNQAVAQSNVSVESISTEANRPWVQHERTLIRDNPALHRFLVCLEADKVFHTMSEEYEQRITRIDMSGGRLGIIPTRQMKQWAAGSANIEFFSTGFFLSRCYLLASHIRDRLDKIHGRFILSRMFGSLLRVLRGDRKKFLAAARQRRIKECPAYRDLKQKLRIAIPGTDGPAFGVRGSVLPWVPRTTDRSADDDFADFLQIAIRAHAEWIRFNDAGLTCLSPAIGELDSLQILELKNNALCEIPDAIGNLSRLEVLALSGNRLRTLPPAIGKLKQLGILGLSSNHLEAITDEIGNATNLYELHLGGNNLLTIPESIGCLQNMMKLNLSNNRLQSLPRTLLQCMRLEYLYLHENPDLNIPANILGPSWLEVFSGNAESVEPMSILYWYFGETD